jgi:ATP-binding protein involved in chromosome partitioning
MKKIIAVASGKGGVGKSTVAANLAVSFANNILPGEERPRKVALIDLDFYGPSIPTMMGSPKDLRGELKLDHEEKFIPPVRHGVKFISIAFFLKNPDDPIIWRGPMFGKAIQQLFVDVSWGDVDLCIVDMPPGTGDAQLSLAQGVQLNGAVIVTTPQEVSLIDVRRAINMFRKVNVPVLGLVENMAGFTTPSGEYFDIFGDGGGKTLASQYQVPFLGSLPLDMSIRQGGDSGNPFASVRELGVSQKFLEITKNLDKVIEETASAEVQMAVVN